MVGKPQVRVFLGSGPPRPGGLVGVAVAAAEGVSSPMSSSGSSPLRNAPCGFQDARQRGRKTDSGPRGRGPFPVFLRLLEAIFSRPPVLPHPTPAASRFSVIAGPKVSQKSCRCPAKMSAWVLKESAPSSWFLPFSSCGRHSGSGLGVKQSVALKRHCARGYRRPPVTTKDPTRSPGLQGSGVRNGWTVGAICYRVDVTSRRISLTASARLYGQRSARWRIEEATKAVRQR